MLIGALILAAAFYAVGFSLFLAALPRGISGEMPTPHADAIVALTGGGDRLNPAIALLEQAAGQRLLITGVNPATTKSELRTLLNGGARFDCCADLGFEATDTIGNARETAAWAARNRYTSLIVVTTDIHMPRSLAEFSAQMPQTTLVPYPVVTNAGAGAVIENFPQLNAEFVKFVASSLRIAMFGNNNSPAERP